MLQSKMIYTFLLCKGDRKKVSVVAVQSNKQRVAVYSLQSVRDLPRAGVGGPYSAVGSLIGSEKPHPSTISREDCLPVCLPVTLC